MKPPAPNIAPDGPSLLAEPWPKRAVIFHWLTFGLVVLAYSSIELRSVFERGSLPRESFKLAHMIIGSALLAVTVLRVGLRLRRPISRPVMPGIQEWLGRRMHSVLLVFLLTMPLLGWLSLSAEGSQLPVLGTPFPSPLTVSEWLAKQAEELHETIGLVGYYLIGLHASAALMHHYLLRDNRLRDMLGRSSK